MRRLPPTQPIGSAGGPLYLSGGFFRPSAWLATGFGPVKGLSGLRLNVLRKSTLQAFLIFSIHIPIHVQVSLTPGTCLIQQHRYRSILLKVPNTPYQCVWADLFSGS
jgi:hypothetical protein